MKFVQTFWTGHHDFDTKARGLDLKAGWLSSEYHWMSWSYSCYQLLKLHSQVELVTDARGKELLIDVLELPFTSVSLALEEESADIHPELFAMAKMKTYSIQTTPFVHVDADLFLYHALPAELLKSPVISSNPEVGLYFNTSILKEVQEQGFCLPDHLKALDLTEPVFSSNAGIMGGNDLALIHDYCQLGFELIERNRHLLKRVKTSDLNFLIEQISLFYLARQREVSIDYVSPAPVTDPLYQDFINFVDVPHVPMVHLVGGCKQSPFMLAHLARRFRMEYPDQYYRIINLCKERGLSIHNHFYRQAGVSQLAQGPSISFVKPDEKELEEESYESQYWRTLRCIDHLKPALNFPASAEALAKTIANEDLPAQCVDIFKVEQLLAEQNLMSKGGWDFQKRYLQDLTDYAQITDTFANGHIKEQDVISLSAWVSLVRCHWNWWKHPDSDFHLTIKENFEMPAELTTVGIVSDILSLSVRLEPLDDLEACIVAGLEKGEKALKNLLSEVYEVIEEPTDSGREGGYKQMMIRTLKRMLFNGILSYQKADNIAGEPDRLETMPV